MTNISQEHPLYSLKSFTENYAGKITASKIARDLKIPQKTAFRKMEQCVKDGILDFEREGRNKNYFLRENKTLLILNMVESMKELNFLISHPEVSLLLEELSVKIGVILFGSYAKGLEKKESDIDLVILSEKRKEFEEIFSRYPFEVNANFVSLSLLEKRLKEKQTLALEIKKNHVLFGEKEKVIKLFIKYS